MTDASPASPAPVSPATPRTVFVTGGTRGIGRAVAARLAAEGHRVAATRRSGDVPDGVLAVDCDITDPAAVDAAFTEVEEKLGAVEVLVANAGITRDGLLLRMGEDDFGDVLETNLTASYRLAKRAARPMMRARWGRMIFVSSIVGHVGGPGQVNYAASKAGLVGLARSIAREFGSRSITANVVAPGFIETDMTAELDEATQRRYAEQIPLGRRGQVDDVAAAVSFLASGGAGYVTGAVLPVDGGVGMGH